MSAKIADLSRISESVKLDYPIEFDGVVFEAITVRTPNVAVLREFARAMRDAPDGVDLRLPMFGDTPIAVLDALHPDDDDRLTEVAGRFLPRRFRADETATASD